MSKVLVGILCMLSGFLLGPAAVHAGVAPDWAPENGDVNGDGKIDLGDPITILGHLFLGGPTELLPFCATPGPSATVPATGQTKCHDADGAEVPCDSATCPGQDGAYGLGCPMGGRFVDGGDGTVLDGCTGLVWQKEPLGNHTWCEALVLCEGLSFAGHDDWRLPNVRELQSLVDYGRAGPSLDPIFVVAGHVGYWSSTGYVGGGSSWSVVFGRDQGDTRGDGMVTALPLSNRFSVRAVRSDGPGGGRGCVSETGDVNGDGKVDLGDPITILGHLFLGGPTDLLPFCAPPPTTHELPATNQTMCHDAAGAEVPCNSSTCPGQDGAYALGCPMEARFVDAGDGTVLDNCTGLLWQKTPGKQDATWCEALAYCEGLSLAGHDDWRLPNVRELHSLVDYGRDAPPLDPVFNTIPGAHPGHWASTTLANDGRLAWHVAFGRGGAAGLAAPIPRTNDLLTVRAVRTPR